MAKISRLQLVSVAEQVGSYLVENPENPEDSFSRDEAHLIVE